MLSRSRRDDGMPARSAPARSRTGTRIFLSPAPAAVPRRNTPLGEMPGADTISTCGTSTRRECSSRNRSVRGVMRYMNAEPKLPGNRTVAPGHSPVPIRLMFACPSICPPPRKNRSIRPWPARSNSSREPSVKGLPVRLCRNERRSAAPALLHQPARGGWDRDSRRRPRCGVRGVRVGSRIEPGECRREPFLCLDHPAARARRFRT